MSSAVKHPAGNRTDNNDGNRIKQEEQTYLLQMDEFSEQCDKAEQPAICNRQDYIKQCRKNQLTIETPPLHLLDFPAARFNPRSRR
ncbi:hypothetical protein D3C76_1607810 [compost metagenome]